MPRGRKRHDPADAPVDGDYTLDQVVGKDKSMAYALVHNEDMPKYLSLGYVAEQRGEGAAKPKWDQGTETDPTYKVRDLTLMKMPADKRQRIDNQALDVSKRRMDMLRKTFVEAGGQFAVPQNNF